MVDNQEELSDLFNTGTSDREMSAAKKRYAQTMKLMNPPSDNKSKGIELKLGPMKKDKPTDLNPVAKKKGGSVDCGCKKMAAGGFVSKANGCAIRGKTKGRIV